MNKKKNFNKSRGKQERYCQHYYLKDVYVANSADTGEFLGAEMTKTDSTWQKKSIRAEFWMRKN